MLSSVGSDQSEPVEALKKPKVIGKKQTKITVNIFDEMP